MPPAFPLRVAIAGVGAFGREHARVVRRLATLAAVADPSPSARDAFAGVPAYPSLGELLRRERVDVVHVCTPTGTHEEAGAEALQAGCHLFAEKPFAENAAGAEWLLRLAEARGVRVCAGHQLLFEPAARRALNELPRIGALVHAESFYSTDARGAALGELLLHPLYVLLHALETAAPGEDAQLDGLHVSPAGTVHALVRRGHAAGTLVVTPEGRPAESSLRLVGTRGTVTADFVRGTVQRLMGHGASAAEKAANPLRLAGQLAGGTVAALARRAVDRRRTYPGLLPLAEAFYRSIHTGGPPPLSPRGIVETLRIWEPIAALLPASAIDASSTPAHHP